MKMDPAISDLALQLFPPKHSINYLENKICIERNNLCLAHQTFHAKK